jgi:4-amino-4-deoxy-L-arabinose transferase-like glycosyltransferase
VFKIASIIFSRKIALLSAFLFAIDIHQALYAVKLLTDTLFVFLFLASIYYLIKNIKENNFLSICLSALFLGIATLVRPISFLFPFVAVVFILVFCSLKLKMKLAHSLLFSIIFIATISPWLFHNYSKYGEAKLSSISGFNLLFYNVAYTEVYKTGKTIEEVRKDFKNVAIKQGIATTINSFKNSQIYSNIGKQYIKDNFILYCKRHFLGIVNMFVNLDTQRITSIFHLKSKPISFDIYGGPGILTIIIDFFQSKTKAEIFIAFGLGFYLLLNYLFSLYGIFLLIGKKEKFVFLFILIILYFSAITGVVGIARYKIPFMPFIRP